MLQLRTAVERSQTLRRFLGNIQVQLSVYSRPTIYLYNKVSEGVVTNQGEEPQLGLIYILVWGFFWVTFFSETSKKKEKKKERNSGNFTSVKSSLAGWRRKHFCQKTVQLNFAKYCGFFFFLV